MISSNLTSVKIEDAKLKDSLTAVGQKDLTKARSGEEVNAKHLGSGLNGSGKQQQQQFSAGGGGGYSVKKKTSKKLSTVVPMESYSISDEESDQTSSIEANLQRVGKKNEMRLGGSSAKSGNAGETTQAREKYRDEGGKNFSDEDDVGEEEDEDDVVENYEDEDSDSFYDADENPIIG